MKRPVATMITIVDVRGAPRRPSRQAPNVRAEADEGGRVQNRVRKPSGIEKFFNFLRGGGREKRERQRAPAAQPAR